MANNRKVLLINPKFQLSFISFFITCAIFNFIILFGVLNFYFIKLKEMMIREGVSASGSLIGLIEFQNHNLNLFLIGGSVIGILSMFFGGLWLSNKIAGPIYRMVNLLNDKIEDPKNYDPITIRNGDYFDELKDAFNGYIECQNDHKKNDTDKVA